MGMKIGFDASDLATGRADGTTRYTRELALRLPPLSPEHDWRMFTPGNFEAELAENARKVIAPWPKYWTQMRLPYDLYREKSDVLFMPIQQLPYIRPGKMKTVAVIHDLAFHECGEQFTYKDWMLLHVFSAYAARHADAIICVSQATADDVERFYGRTENVFVVHHGVDMEKFNASIAETTDRHSGSLGRPELTPLSPFGAKAEWIFGRPSADSRNNGSVVSASEVFRSPYILFIGQIQPRKNIVRLIEAFEIIAEKDKELQLVIAGGHGWLKEPIIRRAKESRFEERIIMSGAVPDEALPAMYAGAEVFVLPSLYEGFGMPILEAMACGCPVVTSNVSSMPEVAGEAAVLVEPRSSEDIARGIGEARERREELTLMGLARVKEFPWGKTASQTLEVILKA